MGTTTFSKKTEILAEVQEFRVASYRETYTQEWLDFLHEHYLGISLAYFLHFGVVNHGADQDEIIDGFIDRAFEDLLEMWQVEDTGFSSLLEITGEAFL